MKCLVISPKNGTVRISRFRLNEFEVTPVQEASVHPIFPPRGSRMEDCEMKDLRRRETAPLELSAGLRARLSACSPAPWMAERQN